ncbi:uncharacterized protein LOC103522703 [Diaphorina citri]|uniref:Uncharacterized protein LOC103522703 n=1 Tax=Diaphorina citri TaxID=121845 RepID=A0A1S4EQW3_DIACI|nr:uncharacterized protein LOC103522703 [Diaphorina citri]
MDLKDALLQFVVKDQDFLGKNEFVGESFLFMNRIKFAQDSEKLLDMEQIHMKLGKPSSEKMVSSHSHDMEQIHMKLGKPSSEKSEYHLVRERISKLIGST